MVLSFVSNNSYFCPPYYKQNSYVQLAFGIIYEAYHKALKTPRQARSQGMVDTILEAATRVLAKRGYSGTNTNLIAEVAGVSVGSIYQYFPNKESIVATLHQRHALQMRDITIHVISRSENITLHGTIKALVKAHLEAHTVEPELHHVLAGC